MMFCDAIPIDLSVELIDALPMSKACSTSITTIQDDGAKGI